MTREQREALAESVNARKDHVHLDRTSALLDDDYDECVFRGTNTLDPSEILRAWDQLAQDVSALQFKSVPHIMHWALLDTLAKDNW